jgi:Acetoacetate decarboxylase (ADC)
MGEATVWGMIDAQPIVFPLLVEDLNAATLVYSVPVEAARAMVPGDLFEVDEAEPGTAHLTVAAVEYRRGSWGSYNSFSFGPRGRPAGVEDAPMGAFLLPTPVNDRFGLEAAHRALGMPGWIEQIDLCRDDDRVTVEVRSGGRPAVTLRLPRVPQSPIGPVRIETVGYTVVDDGLQAVRLEFDLPTGIVDPGDVELELGTGPLADTLRHLGLPLRPDVCMWGERLSAVFHPREPVQEH